MNTGRARSVLVRCFTAGVAALVSAGCQENAPPKIGESLVYAAGRLQAIGEQREVVIRLDQQACLVKTGDVNLRDASGLGVLVMARPTFGWTERTYSFPRNITTVRGYLNISGLSTSFPLVRGTTTVTRAAGDAIDARIDWTIGHPSKADPDTTTTHIRIIGSFHAVPGCGR